jgi:hypothetical protein
VDYDYSDKGKYERVRKEMTLCPSDRPEYSASFFHVYLRLLNMKIIKLSFSMCSDTRTHLG